jgi:putative FmdB family regulatory protein
MPIYEYACQHCDHSLDALQKISDDPLVDCPECGKPALKKQLSAPRFRLKGAGWYETDFKKDNQRNVLKADADSVTSEKQDKKADTKTPDTKSSEPKSSEPKTPDAKPAPKAKSKSETE